MRQYARGRAYDPDRFGGVTPYHEDLAGKTEAKEEAEGAAAHGGPAPEEKPSPMEPAALEPETLDTQMEELNEELDAAIEGEASDETNTD